MDYNEAKKKAVEYGKKRGDKYNVYVETKDAYFFTATNVTDDKPRGVFISKETGKAIAPSTYEKNHNGNIKPVGKPKPVAAEKKVKRK